MPCPYRNPAAPMPRCALALRSRFQNDMVVAWHGHGRGMACVNQTRPHCVNLMGKTQSKPLAARHGWERHGRGMETAWYVCISLKKYVSRCGTETLQLGYVT
jgi:hypothetical protein